MGLELWRQVTATMEVSGAEVLLPWRRVSATGAGSVAVWSWVSETVSPSPFLVGLGPCIGSPSQGGWVPVAAVGLGPVGLSHCDCDLGQHVLKTTTFSV